MSNPDFIQQISSPEFDNMLLQLATGQIQAIEYGDPNAPDGYLSAFRIKYLGTPGGSQFCLKEISRGMEGSGQYFHPGDPTAGQHLRLTLATRLAYYHRPAANPLIRAFLAGRARAPLSFFPIPLAEVLA